MEVLFLLMAVASACIFPPEVPNYTDMDLWVKREAQMQADRNRMGHIQPCPPGYRAGVGFSTISAEDAVRRCCYWRRPSRERWFYVSRGPNGWYAAAIYR
jgi:hypothetical protein